MAAVEVLCVGDLDVDLFVAVPTIPGFDQKVAGRHLGQMPGGMSANSAVAFSRLGHPARLVATIGDDAAGHEAVSKVSAEGVDVGHVVKRPGVNSWRPTPIFPMWPTSARRRSMASAMST
jgi:ribokinase